MIEYSTDGKRKKAGYLILENTREIILDMLMEITAMKEYSHKVIGQVLDKYNYMSGQDKAFMKRVTEGTIERQIQIDHILNSFSSVKVNKMKPLIRNLLRMSVYQLLFMESIPDSAVCNEAVKLVAKRKFQNLKGFVNGVLRNIARNKESIPYPDKEKEPVTALSVLYSCPEWIVEMWLKEYGMEICERMLRALLEIHPVTIRVEESLTVEEQKEVISELEDRAKRIEKHSYLPYAFMVSGVEGFANIPTFKDGKFTIQDVSSMLAVEAAGIKTGDFVLDVCAAPGGKSLHAATKTGEKGQVEAWDVTERKIDLIEENKERLKKEWVRTKVWDASVLDETRIECADVVLADVPCSGLGIFGKKRDIKYRVSRESLAEVAKLQKKIIDTVWQYVKPGGTLLYSTCTINREENQDMVSYITEKYPFETESLNDYLPHELWNETTGKGFLQLLPGVQESDGFFIARLKRKA